MSEGNAEPARWRERLGQERMLLGDSACIIGFHNVAADLQVVEATGWLLPQSCL